MSVNEKGRDSNKLSQVVADARRNMQERERTYREKALKMYPHVCGRCGREFSGKQLRELTVHHRDHNHDNNPPDGSNWELLCIYCHDNEHGRLEVADAYDNSAPSKESPASDFSHKPFAALEALLKGTEKGKK
jgi:5-methylcytosine-specific restriction endonuclease McrA